MAKKRVGKLRRALKQDEFILFRGRNGRVKKHRSDTLLIAEVRNRKTKKLVGYLNTLDKKSKKPVPRRFSSMQKTIASTRRTEAPARRFGELQFRVYTSRLISEQIPDSVIERINDEIDINGEVVLTLKVSTSRDEHFTSDGIFLERRMSKKELATLITLLIVNAAHALQIRTSPKKYQTSEKRKNRQQRRWLDVEIQFGRLS